MHHLLQSLILPAVGSVDHEAESMWIRNVFAEHLRMTLPLSVLKDSADACDNPSIDSVRSAFESLLAFLRQQPSGDQAAWAMLHSIEEACGDFEELALTDDKPWEPFLPVPDVGKKASCSRCYRTFLLSQISMRGSIISATRKWME